MDDKPPGSAPSPGPCPACGNGRLEAVFDGDLTNFLCCNCGSCWRTELGWVHQVNPAHCPGCASLSICLAARHPYGEEPVDPR